MEAKMCRICSKQDYNYVHILSTENLKNKIETCLPIIITKDYPLPDTICNPCVEKIENFYRFTNRCLETTLALEKQYEITQSCLKSKRKRDVGTFVEGSELFDALRLECDIRMRTNLFSRTKDSIAFNSSLVDYEFSSDSEEEPIVKHEQEFLSRYKIKTDSVIIDSENDIINEISQRKYLKRKNDDELTNVSKVRKIDFECTSRRKSRQPKKLQVVKTEDGKEETSDSAFIKSESEPFNLTSYNEITTENYEQICETENDTSAAPLDDNLEFNLTEKLLNLPSDLSVTREVQDPPILMPQDSLQTCLLCERQFYGALLLASHMYDVHGIDLAQVFANSEKPTTKNRKIPNLVKISDVIAVRKQKSVDSSDDPPILEPQERISSPPSVSISSKTHYTCSECQNSTVYSTFKEYSTHRRSQHQIFHCDLCPKFYGRNSHLWKHVNRVHKGHPSITCQQCYKTSASKYHLSQHFNKMHSTKPSKPKIKPSSPTPTDEEFMNQKFQGFDFKSVRQSFLKQELIDKQKGVKKNTDSEDDMPTLQKAKCRPKDFGDPTGYISDSDSGDAPKLVAVKQENIKAPKEIDSTSNLYTNIITNYTPPTNEGPFKCPKCFKGFHKKNLLKKHKKNCRPRLQKDLLTRCKTCSRIFKDRQSLAKHLINYHSEYTCEICNLAVQSKCEIVSHIRFSHPNSELTCYCGQILRSKTDLLKHKSDHRDSHVCQFCGDMLPTKIKLKMHILSLHRKILSLSCGICLKLFETQHILKDHVRLVHKDQLTPLTSCTVCGKNYGSKWKTYDHLNKSHGRIFRACKTCLEVFETEGDLQRHVDTEHVNSKMDKKLVAIKMSEEKEFEGMDANQNSQEYHQEDHITSETEDEDMTESSNLSNIKSLQDESEYRNYIMPKFNSLDKKPDSHNGLGKEKSKGNTDNKISLLEKRLLGKKITEDDIKNSHKEKKKDILENGSKFIERKKSEDERNDMENVYGPNSSKRTVYVNSNDPSLCEICLKVWPAKKHLWQHYIRCHKQVAATVCGICLKTNPSYSSLQTHLRDTHPNLLHGCGFGSNFICKICGRYHNASSKLKLHMAIHVGYNENVLEIEIKEPTEEKLEQELTSDSDTEKQKKKHEGEDINYESLIEEVEASSESDNEEENQNASVTSKQSDQEQEEEEEEEEEEDLSTSECESDSSDDFVENDLEQEMLKNMIGENSVIKREDNDQEEDDEEEELEEDQEEGDEGEERDEISEMDEIIETNVLEPQDIAEQVEIIDQGDEEYEDIEDQDIDYIVKTEVVDSSDVSEDGSYKSYDDNIKPENEDNEDDFALEDCKVKMELCNSNDWSNSQQMTVEKNTDSLEENLQKLFQTKADELDSAIRSISYECENDINAEFTDLQNLQNTLTESELETAVGSIL